MGSFKNRLLQILGIILMLTGCKEAAPSAKDAVRGVRQTEKSGIAYARVIRANVPAGWKEETISSPPRELGQTRGFLCHDPSANRTFITAVHLDFLEKTPEAAVADDAAQIASFVASQSGRSEWISVAPTEPTMTGAQWYSYVYRPEHLAATTVFHGYRKIDGLPGLIRVDVEVDVEDQDKMRTPFLAILDSITVGNP